ncbi:MAG: 16S rRNA (cytosine(1402)-N(4))-methyltransferase RsmH, partial [Candidatus Peribacteraceae bacterium]|nr:16S rRNA (cytosine(1402)-N(4))-methyltransferase RsmH [Candidatus Peribacteraceae bacterium]
LAPKSGDRILDCTLGLGGHATSLLEAAGPTGSLVGLDADQENLDSAMLNLSAFTDQCTFIHSNFSEISNLDIGSFDIIFADLGVSSPHFDDADRGFSFRKEGPLDMRFDRSSGKSAAEIVGNVSSEDLANILFKYGEIRQSRKLADAMKSANITTTSDLTLVIEEALGFSAKSVLPQVFQALRIAVNDELGALSALLDNAPGLLNTGGRLGIIAFHSLEDRAVKQHFRAITAPEIDDRTGGVATEAPFVLLGRKAVKPSEQEIEQNPRARSARLRAIERR